MAYIIPSDITRMALAGAENPELTTLADLKKSLPSDYTVFHGVHWTREYASNTAFGEIDFIVINRAGDVLVIEQKNGWLEEGDAGLFKSYGGKPKNVGEQVRRSLENVRSKFSYMNSSTAQLNLDYLIYAPDHHLQKLNAATLNESRIVHAASPDSLAERIEGVLGRGSADQDKHLQTVEDFFRQTLELVPDVHAHVAAHQRSSSRLTGGLHKVLQNIEVEPLRLRISGTAGCGKSVAARQFFERAADAGRRPLLVCFNRPLAERMKHLVAEFGMVSTWYGFCDQFLTERGHRLEFSRMREDPNFWAEVQDRVVSEKVPQSWMFDTLIVDEGQDFEPEWLDILKLFLHEDHEIIWFEDRDQSIRGASGVDLTGYVTYNARTNFRSPDRISTFISKTLPFSFEPGNALPGYDVGIHRYDDPSEQEKTAGHLVMEMVRSGFDVRDITVLTCRGVNNSALSKISSLGGQRMRRFTGDYDANGNQQFTDGDLLFDSIYRFKGQEAHAVVLVDVDPAEERKQHWERLLFCGMTRATVRLDLLVARGNCVIPIDT